MTYFNLNVNSDKHYRNNKLLSLYIYNFDCHY